MINLRYSRAQRRFETMLKTISRTPKAYPSYAKSEGVSIEGEAEEAKTSFFAREFATLARSAEPTLILRHIRRDLRFVRR